MQDLLICEGSMKKSMVFGYVVTLLPFICLVACEKKSGNAVVIGKDYVAAVKQGEEIKDHRATNHDQWIVRVRMRDNGRTIESPRGSAQWEKFRKTITSRLDIGRVVHWNRLGRRDRLTQGAPTGISNLRGMIGRRQAIAVAVSV